MAKDSSRHRRRRADGQLVVQRSAPGKVSRVQRRYGSVPAGPPRPSQQAPGASVEAVAPALDSTPARELEPEPWPAPERPVPAPPTAPDEELPELEAARARYRAKESLLVQIDAQISQEDADRPRGGAKTRTTRDQLLQQVAAAEAARDAARPALDAARGHEAPLTAFEQAVDALHEAYLASAMQSTDGEVDGFVVGPDLDVLGSSGAHAKMLRWQLASREHYNGTVKFAVPPPATTGGHLVCRVGNPMAVGHNQVGGGDAIAAGFIRVEETGYVVTAFENTSGGYRPGSLRNATARAAIEAARPIAYAVADGARHDNPTGSYDTSTIDRS